MKCCNSFVAWICHQLVITNHNEFLPDHFISTRFGLTSFEYERIDARPNLYVYERIEREQKTKKWLILALRHLLYDSRQLLNVRLQPKRNSEHTPAPTISSIEKLAITLLKIYFLFLRSSVSSVGKLLQNKLISSAIFQKVRQMK